MVVVNEEYIRRIKPPQVAYPEWLQKILDETAPMSSAPKEQLKIEPWMRQPGPPPNILKSQITGPAKPLSPIPNVPQKPKVIVTFTAKSSDDQPVEEFEISLGGQSLYTNERGKAHALVYEGHSVEYSTSAGPSGWYFPLGSRRRKRFVGIEPISSIVTIHGPTTIGLYPESGFFSINGMMYEQPTVKKFYTWQR